jgi:hypothetical protein
MKLKGWMAPAGEEGGQDDRGDTTAGVSGEVESDSGARLVTDQPTASVEMVSFKEQSYSDDAGAAADPAADPSLSARPPSVKPKILNIRAVDLKAQLNSSRSTSCGRTLQQCRLACCKPKKRQVGVIKHIKTRARAHLSKQQQHEQEEQRLEEEAEKAFSELQAARHKATGKAMPAGLVHEHMATTTTTSTTVDFSIQGNTGVRTEVGTPLHDTNTSNRTRSIRTIIHDNITHTGGALVTFKSRATLLWVLQLLRLSGVRNFHGDLICNCAPSDAEQSVRRMHRIRQLIECAYTSMTAVFGPAVLRKFGSGSSSNSLVSRGMPTEPPSFKVKMSRRILIVVNLLFFLLGK